MLQTKARGGAGAIRWGWVALAAVLVAIAGGLGYQELLNSKEGEPAEPERKAEANISPEPTAERGGTSSSPVKPPGTPANRREQARPKAGRTVRASSPEPSATVEIRSVSDSRFRRALRKLQPFGRKRDFVPPAAVRQALPRVPRQLRGVASGEAPVEVKLSVDTSGRVTRVQSLSRDADPRLQSLVINSARQWKFVPARLNGRKLTSELVLRFKFGRQQLASNRATARR